MIPSANFKFTYDTLSGEIMYNEHAHGVVRNGVYEIFFNPATHQTGAVRCFKDIIDYFSVQYVCMYIKGTWHSLPISRFLKIVRTDSHRPKSMLFFNIKLLERVDDKPTTNKKSTKS